MDSPNNREDGAPIGSLPNEVPGMDCIQLSCWQEVPLRNPKEPRLLLKLLVTLHKLMVGLY